MIDLQGVTKTYQSGDVTIRALDHVDFEMDTNEFIVVYGRSGSGKTTLLSMIGGLTRPTSGKVSFNGIDLWTLSDKEQSEFRNKHIGFIFQFSSLIPTLNVMDNMRLPTILTGERRDGQRAARARELLEMVALGHRSDSYPSQLSGGEQRRVAIARALMNRPQVLLADEPTGDLDEETETDVMRVFQQVNGQGTGILMVTHNTNLGFMAGRVVKMACGILTRVK